MGNVPQVGGIVPHEKPSEKEEKKTYPAVDQATRQALGLPPTTPLSVEQGKLVSDFLSPLKNQSVELPVTSKKLIVASRLYEVLNQGLTNFEMGGDFQTTSPSGELVRIKNSEKGKFLKAFLKDLASLLKNGQKSPPHKKAFSMLASRLLESKTFSSLYPSWRNDLFQKITTPLSKTLEQSFMDKPSVDLLESVFVLSAQNAPPPSSAPKIQQAAQRALSPKKPAPIRFLNACARKIVNVLKSFIAVYASLLISETPLKMAHARFHRTVIDSEKHQDSFAILSGGSPSVAFSHFMNHDWKPTLGLVEKEKEALDKNTRERLEETQKILDRSKSLFTQRWELFLPAFLKKKVVRNKIQRLKTGEKLIIPGGMAGHAILYEATKTEEGFIIRVFNAGGGTRPVGSRFQVEEYTVKKERMGEVIDSLVSIKDCSGKQLAQKYEFDESDPSLLNSVIQKIIGHPPDVYEYHELQDRGNCFWKSFSTWMNSQLKGCRIAVSPQMVKASKKKAPYATEDLTLLERTKEKIPLSRFMHRIAYEKLRATLTDLFARNTPPHQLILKKLKIKFYTFVEYNIHFEPAPSKEETERYITSLIRTIIRQPAAARYQKKGLMRRWRARSM